MSETQVGKGSCLCGTVKFTATEMSRNFGVCHCEMCRKWSGGPYMSVSCGSKVEFSGEEFIGVYDSSAWAERGFCQKCGSNLFYRIKTNGQCHMPIGLFDSFEEINFKLQVFIDKKPAFYQFANETVNMTEAEVFAKYGPSD
jgi:hypothetical protein